MAPKGRDPNPSGLGRAIINRKVKDARKAHESGLFVVDSESTKSLKSVTQERDLDEFLNTAQLAGTDFTAEKRNIKVIPQTTSTSHNPYLLSEAEEKKVLQQQDDNKQRLRVPRRPPWKKSMTPVELDRQEKAAFLEWRRGLADLQDKDNFLLTPFERNIEVWRQLWRVLERSHLVVQIVDARNPLRFRCDDLEAYVSDVEGTEGEAGTGKGKRKSMLLINKADLLTLKQRIQWADYFDSQGIQYAFYSAADVAAMQEARRAAAVAELDEESDEESDSALSDDDLPQAHDENAPSLAKSGGVFDPLEGSSAGDNSLEHTHAFLAVDNGEREERDPRARVLSVEELEAMFVKVAPDLSEFAEVSGQPPSRLVVGLVGYPNVGKSSTINSLLGEKKVSVSSTPGKTKHFQTIHLSETIVLCDCPGLVFPQFATTKADLVCDGVLPIDQLREHTGPVTLITKRLPKSILEATYGLTIRTTGVEEGGDDSVTSENFLIAYAIARGYSRSGQGNPDEARAARYVLKDYVNGKLLFCHSPPGVSDVEFNQPTYQNALTRLAGRKHAPVTRVGKDSDTFVPSNYPSAESNGLLPAKAQGMKSRALDQDFFESNSGLRSSKAFVQQNGKEISRVMLYPHQTSVGVDGTPIDAQQARLVAILRDSDTGKKHKKMKRTKQRSGRGYD
ncbi:P-loop containing nucleoside triphosphate hydrolase protein [Crepidotus variabilis]|uniref:P-loop containing nucleoside triphosphate hydrolase protein n=1 Tax=Crepidotus variabilis TaxID=179855 RepID=A0A9P6JP45_9AGAR|nr:P-loop containing nucleoside triphosphate hydrolase protein [Crepidotus variabilis]